MEFLEGSQNAHVELNAYQVEGGFHIHTGQVGARDKSLYELLQPIDDASHTRDRKRSPPDSACTQGTRLEVVRNVTTWTDNNVSDANEPHILWMHGYVGCGKSAISQEVCRKSQLQGRPVASFFFFRNAGDRSNIWRLATTLADQMSAVVPETAPLVRAAVTATPGLKNFPVPITSVAMQMQSLVYGPLKAAAERSPMGSLRGHPFLIVIDGLDECENKEEIQDLIEGMLAFFDSDPLVPLRIFITSRVEQHIQSHLDVPRVPLTDLVDHCSDDDIATFLNILFESERRRNPVVRSYISEHGEWPIPSDKQKLMKHIGGSFIFASSIFKFIMGSNTASNDPKTPMDRLPLALKMNPGLDELYAQTLARSEHLPDFLDITSTIALLEVPLPTSGIAELLGISTYQVVNVLVNLQTIIQVPGTDDMPVTLFHTSLRDFLTTHSRSNRFFAHPSHHVRLFLLCLQCELALRRRNPGSFIYASERKPAAAYALQHSVTHLNRGQSFFKLTESDSAVQLCLETLGFHPGAPELIRSLGRVTLSRFRHTGSLVDLEKAISLNREVLELHPSPHPDRASSLNNIGNALLDRYRLSRAVTDLEEAICLHHEALGLRPSPHPDRALSLSNLGNVLHDRYRHSGTMTDLEESICFHREALGLRPSPHPDRALSLNNFGNALRDRYRLLRTVTDLEEAICLHREGLGLRSYPHPDRALLLNNFGNALHERYRLSRTMNDLEEAICLHREALGLRPSPHPDRALSLNNLGNALQDRYRRSKTKIDLEEAVRLHREALVLRLPPHADRCSVINSLGTALLDRYRHIGTMADLEEAIPLHCEALGLQPSPHPDRWLSLNNLGNALLDRYRRTGALDDLKEATSLYREALELQPSQHSDRSSSLNNLGHALLHCYRRTGPVSDLVEAISLCHEALDLLPSPHPHRAFSLRNLSISLHDMYKETRALPHLQAAILHCEELLASHYLVGHQHRFETLNHLTSLLRMRFDETGQEEDLVRIASLKAEASQSATSTSTA